MEKKDKETVVTPAMQALATATGNAAVAGPKKTRTVDHEMAALKKCREALAALSTPSARYRILAWLNAEAQQVSAENVLQGVAKEEIHRELSLAGQGQDVPQSTRGYMR